MRFAIILCLLLLAVPADAAEKALVVISDINNTMRDDGAVEGMPQAYQRLAKAGATFHYVSYSHESERAELIELFESSGYPKGELHLQGGTSRAKTSVVAHLIGDNPDASFIMVGDSGMQDAEMYALAAHTFPGHVRHIYIRNVSGEGTEARMKAFFEGLPDDLWTLFDDPAVIKP